MAFEIVWVPLLHVFLICLRALRFMIVAYWIVDICFALNALNRNSVIVYNIRNTFMRLLEPFISPLRRIIPPLGGISFAPLVLLLLLQFLSEMIQMVLAKHFSI